MIERYLCDELRSRGFDAFPVGRSREALTRFDPMNADYYVEIAGSGDATTPIGALAWEPRMLPWTSASSFLASPLRSGCMTAARSISCEPSICISGARLSSRPALASADGPAGCFSLPQSRCFSGGRSAARPTAWRATLPLRSARQCSAEAPAMKPLIVLTTVAQTTTPGKLPKSSSAVAWLPA